MHTRSVLGFLTVLLMTGCAPATRMARPRHVPEPAWAQCEAEATRRMTPEATAAGVAGMTSIPVGMADGAILGLAAVALSNAIAPDAATADAWGVEPCDLGVSPGPRDPAPVDSAAQPTQG